MTKHEELVLRKAKRKSGGSERALQKLDGSVLERLRRATELENPYKIRADRRRKLEQTTYEESLKEIIRQDYFPDLEYMSRNKDDHDSINTIINNPPGTLNINSFDDAGNALETRKVSKSLLNVTEFQSKYTHRGNLSLLALTNEEATRRRERESWMEEQSFCHNLKRELNIIEMQKKNKGKSEFDERSLILNKSQSRSNFMFTDYSHNHGYREACDAKKNGETVINPRNTRYNYMDDFERDERMLVLNRVRHGKVSNRERTSVSSSLLMKSPLVRNALRRSQKTSVLFDNQLRNSYSYNGKSKRSLSRFT